ncbi:hypothetical protein GOBAR_AA25936 [Gossypium barbadense]|uniref:Uncharacterized protein n=1 Tax=Gossypium barbadense TaxID=3634 RepID=A0A2P5WUG0_GOSBA|nr:hypothetical protein GOBAR_AA25936 [Gossypium barbadense]
MVASGGGENADSGGHARMLLVAIQVSNWATKRVHLREEYITTFLTSLEVKDIDLLEDDMIIETIEGRDKVGMRNNRIEVENLELPSPRKSCSYRKKWH